MSQKVKAKVVAMLYSWTVSLPNEAKISQAYQMLKSQGENDTDDFMYVTMMKLLFENVTTNPLLPYVTLDVLSVDPEISLDADASIPSPRQQSPVFGDEKKNKVRTFMGLLTDALS